MTENCWAAISVCSHRLFSTSSWLPGALERSPYSLKIPLPLSISPGLRLTWGGACHRVKVEVSPGVILGPDPGDHHQDHHRGHEAHHGQIVTEAEAHQHVSLASLDT